jgi:DNA-binding XRE family transcriptional regulator
MLKTHFRIALSIAGMTQAQWARQQGVTRGAITLLLNEQMKSKRLSKAIEKFIGVEFKKLKIQTGSIKQAV